jgi:hypothetical protein
MVSITSALYITPSFVYRSIFSVLDFLGACER